MVNFAKIEYYLRGICFFAHLIFALIMVAVTEATKPLEKIIAKKYGHLWEGVFHMDCLQDYWIHYGFCPGMFATAGINVHVTFQCQQPKHSKDRKVVMFTHGSNLDPPAVNGSFPFTSSFISKKDLFKVPLLGWCLKLTGQIPVDRGDLEQAKKSLDEAAQLCRRENRFISISVEGKRRRDPSTGPDQLLPFKKGPFHMAKKCAVDIIPCILKGAHRLWPPGTIFPKSGQMFMEYLEAIPGEEVEKLSVEELQDKVRKIMTARMDRLPDEVVFSQEDKPW
eukprot:CAMPEP_0114589146 /NCGR_PEP_ID=MMETSP0125-20121206/11672_1 /TAXON_ID=485358 ORGANISM="Aristerostoma sp., Strain ATCC 50986" /NCGR_SAMPLE_ID=MMETSP0125 /ASSEMBLY_ACC=CAM_ASM_000245 /LENGTH=279 /DNA_ID=CAMNT_0001785897 /DNA_START=32 /DNA_END=868 /DNA_ORIENTATION=+